VRGLRREAYVTPGFKAKIEWSQYECPGTSSHTYNPESDIVFDKRLK
jgi:hypothetical protein